MKELKHSLSVLMFLLLSITIAFSEVVFEDDFETDKNWQLVNTSDKGNWERADPQGTTYQMNVTPGAGYYALVTDGRGGSDSYYDVDGGETALQSPEITLPSSGNITISFYYYLGHRSDANSTDYFRVKIKVGSNETVLLEELANNGEDQPTSYDYFCANLNSFAGQTVRVLIEAADNSGTLLEASVDELLIECTGGGSITQIYETPNYPSNYPNNVNETVTIGKHETWGGTGYEIEVFGESETNYDYLYLKQGGQNLRDPIHGDLGAEGIVVNVPNDDPVDVTFTSDGSVTRQGFHVEAVEGGPPPVDELVLQLKMDEGSGSNLSDASGKNHNGTIHNNPTWTNNNCIELDGALSLDEVDEYITISNFNYTVANEFTVSFWFNVSGNSGSNYKYIFSHGAVSSANSLNIYFYEDDNSSFPRLRTNLRDVNNLPGSSDLDIDEDFTDGKWHLYSLSVSPGDIKVYIDGEEKAYSNSGFSSFNPGTALHIGGREDLNQYRFFGGLIDEFRIYNYSLDETEIGDLLGGCKETSVGDVVPLRIAYTHELESAWGYEIPDSFLQRAQRNGYNYVLAGFNIVPPHWDSLTGRPNNALRDGLDSAFKKVDRYGMKLIPLFQMGNMHTSWVYANENIQWNKMTKPNDSMHQISPDAPGVNGLDFSFELLIEATAEGFDQANLPYKLDFIHLGHDEMLSPAAVGSGEIGFGECPLDSSALESIISATVSVEEAHHRVFADELRRRVNTINNVFTSTFPDSMPPKVMIFADMLDSNFLGGWELDNWIDGSTVSTARGLGDISLQNDLILMPWMYFNPHPWAIGQNYDTYETIKSFSDAGYKFIYTFGLSGSKLVWDTPTFNQLGQWYTHGLKPEFADAYFGYCSVHWNFQLPGQPPGQITENHWKSMEFNAHSNHYFTPIFCE